MINLEKKENLTKAVSFGEEDFSKIKWQNLKENKRIFIPYSELPEGSVERRAFLDSLTSFIEKETGKHCSYIPVNETEPYEVNGFYVQLAPELLDFRGKYVENNSLVCDRGNGEWHVSYYYENNAPHIVLDNEDGCYMVVKNLSEFSSLLGAGHLIPIHKKEEDNQDSEEDVAVIDESKCIDDKCEKNEKINKVILTVGDILLLIGFVILFVFGLKCLIEFANDVIENMASENIVSETCAWLFHNVIYVSISFICLDIIVKMVKRVMRW